MNSDSIPIDLIIEIFSRLPSKSVARFHCVSKLWSSIFVRPYFTELFLTRSSTKPCLLFAIAEDDGWSFFSLPQRHNPYEKSSSTLVVTEKTHVKFPDYMRIDHNSYQRVFSCVYASGLIYFSGSWYDDKILICNPNTGQYATLPYLRRCGFWDTFFVFEPTDKQYKVLFMADEYYNYNINKDNKVFTLGTEDKRWRTIKCSLRHNILSEGICINGVLYYLAVMMGRSKSNDDHHDVTKYLIVCFDVRSEKFTFVDISIESFCRLINYKGKLAVIYWDDDFEDDVGIPLENDVNIYLEDDVDLRIWVLEDVEKQEWSKYTYTLSIDKIIRPHVSIVGATASGEIIFSMREYISKKPFYVFYFNPERNNLQRIEILGFGETLKKPGSSVYTFVDHVEDLNVNDPKLLKLVHTPFVGTEESRPNSFEKTVR